VKRKSFGNTALKQRDIIHKTPSSSKEEKINEKEKVSEY
jgi:hypothetical protein